MTAERVEAIMDSAVGVTLRFYAQRVLQLFITEWRAGMPIDEQDYIQAQQSVDKALARAIDYTGESVRDIIRANADRARGQMAGDGPVVIEDGLSEEERAYRRLTQGMSGVGRILTTRAREEAKYDFAKKMGAVGKAWRTRRDARVRVTHADLEGDFVPLDDPFTTVAGYKIQRPGDPKAPLSETIFCRCRLSYRMPTTIREKVAL